MRLLFVAPDMHRGGAERHWATLIPALARRGAEVRLLCLNDEGAAVRGGARRRRAGDLPAPGRARRRRRRCAARSREAGAAPGRRGHPRREPAAGRRGDRPPAPAPPTCSTSTRRSRPTASCSPLRPHQRALTRLVAPRGGPRDRGQRAPRSSRCARLGYRRERIVVVPNGLFDSDVAVHARARRTPAASSAWTSATSRCCAWRTCAPRRASAAFVEAVARGAAAGAAAARAAGRRRPASAPQLERWPRARGRPAARLARRRARPARGLRRALPAQRGRGAADEHPRGDGAGRCRWSPPTSAAPPRRWPTPRPGSSWSPRDTGAAAAALARLAAQPEWARELGERGRERQRERFDGEAMVDGYERALAEVASR